jgi:DnaD/phage-associated family protein
MSKPQTIFRVIHDKETPFVIMDKRPFEKPYMSWKAKGLLGYLLSRPDDWTVRLGDLVKRSTDKAHATRQALRELVMVGHMRQVEYRHENGKYAGTVYEVHEQPLYENPLAVYPKAENRTLNNIESSNKDSKREIAAPDVQVFQALEQLIGTLPSGITRYVDTWLEKHPLERVFQAIDIAREKGARSEKYVDKILIGWEANGYPRTREEQIAEAKKPARTNGKTHAPSHPVDPSKIEAAKEAAAKWAKQLEARS